MATDKKTTPQTYLLPRMNTLKSNEIQDSALCCVVGSWMWGLLDSLNNLTYTFTIN